MIRDPLVENLTPTWCSVAYSTNSQKSRAHGGLAAPDVHVEDLHPLELVDEGLALVGGELVRVTPARAGQAVHAGQIAGVGQLPGETDGRVQTPFELVDQTGDRPAGGHRSLVDQGHGASRGQIMPDSARVARARS